MNVKELIKMEFKRVFHSKMFYLSLGIGLLITTLQWIEVGLPMAVNIVDGYIPSEVSTPYSAFESFFGRSAVRKKPGSDSHTPPKTGGRPPYCSGERTAAPPENRCNTTVRKKRRPRFSG